MPLTTHRATTRSSTADSMCTRSRKDQVNVETVTIQVCCVIIVFDEDAIYTKVSNRGVGIRGIATRSSQR